MRASEFLLSTLKETPSDAEVISHQLMLRAGLIRRVAAGIYNWMPLGLRVLRKVEQVVREEMERAGALELSMPVVQPGELWQESGRWELYGPELCRLEDRHQRPFCLGPTHEEVITQIAASEIKSYKQLPVNLFQIQTKFRDEIRPRFGVMRSREFIMKDAYSFHIDQASQEQPTGACTRLTPLFSRGWASIFVRWRPIPARSAGITPTSSTYWRNRVRMPSPSRQTVTTPRMWNWPQRSAVQRATTTVRHPRWKDLRRPGMTTIDHLAEQLGIPAQRVDQNTIGNG